MPTLNKQLMIIIITTAKIRCRGLWWSRSLVKSTSLIDKLLSFYFIHIRNLQQILHSTIPIELLCNTTGTMQRGAKDNDYPRA